MIVEPEQRVADFIKAGSDIVSVHAEQSATIHLHRLVNNVRSLSIMLTPAYLRAVHAALQIQRHSRPACRCNGSLSHMIKVSAVLNK